MLGKTQSFAREFNNHLVLEALEKKPMSATELSSCFHLSNATLSSVLKSLTSMGLIEPVGLDSVSGSGRKRVQYALSSQFGTILVVDFGSEKYHARLYDLPGNILFEEENPLERYDVAHIEPIVASIQKGISNIEMPVRYTVLCLPGLVSTQSGELQFSSRFDSALFSPKNKLQNLFSEAFSCPVKLENDTKIMMSGELALGRFEGVNSGLLAFVDYGIGGAFEFQGSCFRGGRGYSGEIGRVLISGSSGEVTNLDDAASIRALKDQIQAKTGERPHTKEIVERFHHGDAFIRDLVLISAEKLGEGLRLIHSVMDLERIVVSGRVSLFGEEYLARVQQSFGEGPRICYGASYEDALFYGAKKLGLSYLWNNVPKSSPAKEE